jgi:hypothetical protein
MSTLEVAFEGYPFLLASVSEQTPPNWTSSKRKAGLARAFVHYGSNEAEDNAHFFTMFHQDGGTGGRGCVGTHKGDVTRVPPNFRDFLGNGGRGTSHI